MTKRKEVRTEGKGKDKSHRNKEKLSIEDLEDLMGVHQDTYKRVHGRVRRK